MATFRELATQRLLEKSIPEPNSGCWLWLGGMESRGDYGTFTMRALGYIGKKAHRVSYEMFVEDIPEGMVVMHTCDIPSCINPDHLRLGTQAENMRDMALKGRQAKGSSHGHYKHGRYIGVNSRY